MAGDEPSVEEVPVESGEDTPESPTSSPRAVVPGPVVPPPTVPVVVGLVRGWSPFDLLRLVTALVHEIQAKVVEEERAREDAALATRLGAPWRSVVPVPTQRNNKGRGKGSVKGGETSGSGRGSHPY